ncbi:hypothetical protein GCM10027052_30120 [Parafrigoribacterium mesophilum]|uniref:PLDc N-terminal domain-containing protein n=1 Tax=Parafrigoribacterium mesophilum TaxID=433646 RepID=UPI0031FCD5A2
MDVTAVVVLSVLGFAAAAVIVGLVIVALLQIAKTDTLDNTGRAVWILIVIIAPVFGAAIWFWIGTRTPTLTGR